MEENILSNEEGIEPGEDQGTGKQELDDATNEPRSAVEQSGDYDQAETIQASLTHLADAAETVDLPVKPANPAGGVEELPLPCPPGDLPEGSARLDEPGKYYAPNPGKAEGDNGWLPEDGDSGEQQIKPPENNPATLNETIDPSQLEYEPGHPPEPPDLDHGYGPPKSQLDLEEDNSVLGRQPKVREDLGDLEPAKYYSSNPGKAEGDNSYLPEDGDSGEQQIKPPENNPASLGETIDPSQLEYEPGPVPQPPDWDHGPPKDRVDLEEDDSVLGRMPKMREDLSDLKPAGSDESDEVDEFLNALQTDPKAVLEQYNLTSAHLQALKEISPARRAGIAASLQEAGVTNELESSDTHPPEDLEDNDAWSQFMIQLATSENQNAENQRSSIAKKKKDNSNSTNWKA